LVSNTRWPKKGRRNRATKAAVLANCPGIHLSLKGKRSLVSGKKGGTPTKRGWEGPTDRPGEIYMVRKEPGGMSQKRDDRGKKGVGSAVKKARARTGVAGYDICFLRHQYQEGIDQSG